MEQITIQNNIETIFDHSVKHKKSQEEQDGSFNELLKNSISKVNQLHNEADNAIKELASGNENNIHQTMIALKKAEISFELMMQVRNKIISAYEEVMRMQV